MFITKCQGWWLFYISVLRYKSYFVRSIKFTTCNRVTGKENHFAESVIQVSVFTITVFTAFQYKHPSFTTDTSTQDSALLKLKKIWLCDCLNFFLGCVWLIELFSLTVFRTSVTWSNSACIENLTMQTFNQNAAPLCIYMKTSPHFSNIVHLSSSNGRC